MLAEKETMRCTDDARKITNTDYVTTEGESWRTSELAPAHAMLSQTTSQYSLHFIKFRSLIHPWLVFVLLIVWPLDVALLEV